MFNGKTHVVSTGPRSIALAGGAWFLNEKTGKFELLNKFVAPKNGGVDWCQITITKITANKQNKPSSGLEQLNPKKDWQFTTIEVSMSYPVGPKHS